MALSGFRAVLSRAMPDPAAALHRLQPGDLRVGEPLPFDLYDGTGRRLVQAGVVIAEDAQLERLLARGIHCDAERFEALKAAPPEASGSPAMVLPRVMTVRPWRLLHALRDALEDALPRIATGSGDAGEALGVVRHDHLVQGGRRLHVHQQHAQRQPAVAQRNGVLHRAQRGRRAVDGQQDQHRGWQAHHGRSRGEGHDERNAGDTAPA
jgi:hypothetical protein